ncbi:DegQ family serine endoprotease [Endozoicomonas elysicola]|uniref:Probable periplasmic serine endoprotease DegP-like n=1 Tax=Endozoicomonas elysicola TaxID=305900 RepID=A0A081KBR5_9GAMM|nr:DegQ family serine endoprotease [Endozoicomonas elysicola]KEI71591.1 serine peptidase [Endozoicomonas elysicola]
MSRVFFLFKKSFCNFGLSVILLCASLSNASADTSGLPNFTGLFEQASPAVVNISTLAKAKARQQIYGPGGEELPEIFRRYFGIPLPDEGASGNSQPMSLGSGFIISSDGYILTNNHVVDGADQIIVRLSDRSERPAELIGADKRSDLALLKIESDRSLPVVKIGDSEGVKPGEWVAAIGSPFNFEYSITKGIVSALNRSLPSDSYVPFIQTDVPINPGNSGGPLFNMEGEVIGINSQIFTRSGGFMGLSFAIPVDHVMWAVDQLKDKGYVTRGWLGVAIQDVDRDLAESFGLERPMGALVSQVVPGGPADKAKLHPGDIIVRFNNRAISNSGILPMSVGVIKPGEKAKLEFIRNGKRKLVDVEVGQLPDENSSAPEKNGDKPVSDKNPLGVKVAELDENYRSKLRLEEDVQGLVVIGVNRGAGRSIGLRQGDVITDLNNRSVTTVSEFKKVVAKLPKNRSISMRVIRGGNPGYITFRLQE